MRTETLPKNCDCIVFVVDDDPSVCKGLSRLLHSAGYHTETHHSAADFLRREPHTGTGCLVLDVRMPDLSGIELQQQLNRQGIDLPVIFLTAHGDLTMGVKAMKRGAEDFLSKPVDENSLLDAVQRALQRHRTLRVRTQQRAAIQKRLDQLTARELEVLQCILSGAINREIAAQLAITEKTVKAHRARVMDKMKAASPAELGKICAWFDLSSTHAGSR